MLKNPKFQANDGVRSLIKFNWKYIHKVL